MDEALSVAVDTGVAAVGGKVVGKIVETVGGETASVAARAVTRFESTEESDAVAPKIEQTANDILNRVTKLQAKDSLRKGIEGVSKGQTQKALDILNKGRIDSFTMKALENNQLQMITERAGAESGFQRVTYTLNDSGEVLSVLQQTYNDAGELIHEDWWLPLSDQ